MLTRRELLCRASSGLGIFGLAGLLAEAQEAERRSNPLLDHRLKLIVM